jgi:hypothetical protein
MLQTSDFVKVRGSGKFEVYFLAASVEVCVGFKYDSTIVLITFSVPIPQEEMLKSLIEIRA